MSIQGNAFGETLLIRESTRNSVGATSYKESYYGKDLIFIDDSSTPLKTLIDFKKKKVFLISVPQQQVTSMSLEKYMQVARNAGNAMFAGLSDSDVVITSGTTIRTIRGYSCTEISAVIHQYNVEIHYWVASPSKGVSLENYFLFSKTFGAGLSMAKLNAELVKHNVYPIEGWIRSGMGERTDLQCLEIRMLKPQEKVPGIPETYHIDNIPD
jgi:hypothetical protein